jgi:hypothetical protein
VDLGVTAKHHAEVVNSEGTKICSSVSFPGTKEGFDMLKCSPKTGQGNKVQNGLP